MLAVVAEGHGLLAAQPGHKIFVGAHQTIGLHREEAGTQVVDDLVGPIRLRGDVGVKADERLTYPEFDHHITELAGTSVWGTYVQRAGRRVSPSDVPP